MPSRNMPRRGESRLGGGTDRAASGTSPGRNPAGRPRLSTTTSSIATNLGRRTPPGSPTRRLPIDRLILAINRRSAELFGFGAEKVGSFSRAQDQIRRPPPIINRDFWFDLIAPTSLKITRSETFAHPTDQLPVRHPAGSNPQQVAVSIFNKCGEELRRCRLGRSIV